MAGLEPLSQQDVPFRKVREAINLLVNRINKQRPITDGPVELLPNGFRVKRDNGSSDQDMPPFHPTLVKNTSNTSLYIKEGWMHLPKASKTYGEIPEYALYPWMPEITSRPLNHDEPYALGLTWGATNYVYLTISLDTRETPVGDSEAVDYNGNLSGEVGCTVNIPTQGITIVDDNGDTGSTTWNAEAYVLLNNISYDVSSAPQFAVSTVEFPVDEEEAYNLPWGKYILDSEGVATTSEWYWTGHRQLPLPTFLTGGQASGYTTPPSTASGDDTSANPRENTNTL